MQRRTRNESSRATSKLDACTRQSPLFRVHARFQPPCALVGPQIQHYCAVIRPTHRHHLKLFHLESADEAVVDA